ncbi:CRAL/TRIO domain [Popillia japonica]|uniref:CRAL/TRIO domain n=1 Tax=Popillia japonica TaxID=7064 RepID=A0AAW1N7B3_POPJA
MAESMKLLFMTIDAALHEYPPTGLIILFDMKGVGLMHLTRIKLGCIKAFFEYCQDCLPVKLKTIHVLNSVYFLDKILAIIKPFIKKELYELIHFHPPNLNMEKFYRKYISKECLPSDYGGDLPNTRILHEMNTKRLGELKPFFDAEETFRTTYYNKLNSTSCT